MTKRQNDVYKPRPEFIGALEAVLNASNKKELGKNGAAKLERLNFMKKCIRLGLVAPEHVHRANRTVINLESQL